MPRGSSPALLPILRSQTQANVLARLLLTPPTGHTVRELADATGSDAWSVRRELGRLERAGIVSQESVGGASVFHPAEDSPLLEPLRTLLERSVGAVVALEAVVGRVAGVEAAAVYGSWARGDVDPGSDVDLLVVGDVDYDGLVDALAAVERRLGRDVDLLVLTGAEFRARLRDGSPFILEILGQPSILLVGRLPERPPS